eukprot:m.235669 g.235669  ORF g.235669 m.235669 type:complete len:394 (+) comp12858_c0_seq1:40-1221(+)
MRNMASASANGSPPQLEAPLLEDLSPPHLESDPDTSQMSGGEKRKRGRPVGSRNQPCALEKKQFQCSACPNRYKTQPGLKYHILHAHRTESIPSFPCAVCHKSFESNSRLLNHTRKHKDESSEVRIFPCAEPGCLKVFTTPSGLAYHARTAHTDQRTTFTCPHEDCGRVLTSRAGLAVHMNQQHTAPKVMPRPVPALRLHPPQSQQLFYTMPLPIDGQPQHMFSLQQQSLQQPFMFLPHGVLAPSSAAALLHPRVASSAANSHAASSSAALHSSTASPAPSPFHTLSSSSQSSFTHPTAISPAMLHSLAPSTSMLLHLQAGAAGLAELDRAAEEFLGGLDHPTNFLEPIVFDEIPPGLIGPFTLQYVSDAFGSHLEEVDSLAVATGALASNPV